MKICQVKVANRKGRLGALGSKARLSLLCYDSLDGPEVGGEVGASEVVVGRG